MKSICAPIICLAAFMTSAVSAQEIRIRYTALDDCEMIGDGMALEGRDWVSYRCSGLGKSDVWITNVDSTRSSIGFGSRENLSGVFSSKRDCSWPLEWRGIGTGDNFRPFAVIARMRRPQLDDSQSEPSFLFVYRLREDGTSCLIATDLKSNEEARDAADASQNTWACLEEPRLPD